MLLSYTLHSEFFPRIILSAPLSSFLFSRFKETATFYYLIYMTLLSTLDLII